MIATILQILFPVDQVDQHGGHRRSLSAWLHSDAQRLARRIEPLFSHAMLFATAGLVLMMVARIAIAWAQGRL